MIDGNMSLVDVVEVLATGGLRIVSLTALRGGEFVVRLRVDPAHVIDPAMTHAEGRGATIAEALEDARQGWVSFAAYRRERALAQAVQIALEADLEEALAEEADRV